MEKKQGSEETLDILRDHLGAIDLICRLLFLAAATEGFILSGHSIGHLANFLYQFRVRHLEILTRKGV